MATDLWLLPSRNSASGCGVAEIVSPENPDRTLGIVCQVRDAQIRARIQQGQTVYASFLDYLGPLPQDRLRLRFDAGGYEFAVDVASGSLRHDALVRKYKSDPALASV